MPTISPRLTTLNDAGSDGWEVFYRARAMIAAGTSVTELTIGEHDIGTHPAILHTMHEAAMSGHTGYAIVPGIPALRDAVAARITARTGTPTSRDNILITPGGQAALFAAHMAACAPGDTALYIDPYYATYPGTLRAAGAQPHAIKTRAENDFLPAEADLASAPQAASLLLNSPNNPTGTIYEPDTWGHIARFAADRDLWVISDEVYDTQIWDGHHISARGLPDLKDRSLIVGSMSKSFAMTGSRIGWLAGPEEAIAAVIDLATTTTYGVPGFIQEAALWALTEGQHLEAEVAAPFRRRRDLVVQRIAASNTLRCVPPKGAMYVMLDIRSTGLSGEAFANALLDAHHIAVMPGESFGSAAAGHIRLALTQPDDILLSTLDTLIAFATARAA